MADTIDFSSLAAKPEKVNFDSVEVPTETVDFSELDNPAGGPVDFSSINDESSPVDFTSLLGDPDAGVKELADITQGPHIRRPGPLESLAQATDQFQASLGAGIELAAGGVDLPYFDDLEQFGAEVKARNLREAARYGVPEVTLLSEIEGPVDTLKFVQFALAQGFASMGFSIGAGAVGAAGGAIVGGPPGALAGGIFGAAGVSFLANTGEVANAVEAEGVDASDERQLIIGAGIAMAGLDLAGLTFALRPFVGTLVKSVGKKATIEAIKGMGVKPSLAKGAVNGLLAEGPTEGAQEFISANAASIATGLELTPAELRDRVATATTVGALTGGVVGGLAIGGSNTLTSLREAGAAAHAELQDIKLEKLADRMMDDPTFTAEQRETVMAGLSLAEDLKATVTSLQQADPAFSTTEKGLATTLATKLFLRTAALNEAWRAKSPTLRRLHEMVARDITDPTALVGASLQARWNIMSGTWQRSLEEATLPIQHDPQKLELFATLMRTPDEEIDVEMTSAAPDVVKAVADARGIMDTIHSSALERGIDTGYIRGFLPNQYVGDAIAKNQEGFQAMVLKHLPDISPKSLERVMNKLISDQGFALDAVMATDITLSEKQMNLLAEGGEEAEALLKDLQSKKQRKETRAMDRLLGASPRRKRNKSLERARILRQIPSNEAAEFLNNDPIQLLQNYARSVSKRLSYVDLFGVQEEKLAAMLVKGTKEATDAGHQVTTDELHALRVILDSHNQMNKPFTDQRSRRLDEALTFYTYLRVLPLATLSSLTEPLLLIMSAPTGSAMHGIKIGLGDMSARMANASIRALGGKNKFRRQQDLINTLGDIGLANHFAGAQLAAARYTGTPIQSERLNRWTEKFFRINGLEGWTMHTRMMALATFDHMTKANVKKMRDGTMTPGQLRRWSTQMLSLGVDPQDLMVWQSQMDANNGNITPEMKKTAFYQGSWLPAKLTFVNSVVMHPDPSLKPIWANDPHFRFLGIIKSFQFTFNNVVLRKMGRALRKKATPGLQTEDQLFNATKMIGAVLPMVAVAFMVNDMRDVWKGRDPSDLSISDRILRAMDRTGLMGIFSLVREATMAHTFGGNFSAPLTGPILGQTLEVGDALSVALNTSLNGGPDFQPLIREFVDAIPGVSAGVIPGLREVVREGLQEVADDMGLAGQ